MMLHTKYEGSKPYIVRRFFRVFPKKAYVIQSKLFITSLVITEYSISDIKLLGTDLFPLKFPLYNRIFT